MLNCIKQSVTVQNVNVQVLTTLDACFVVEVTVHQAS
ncbi:Uncharacterised protein [Vibrio cholerae]|nr:Uncharacterised protein [Vibrio cholerae]